MFPIWCLLACILLQTGAQKSSHHVPPSCHCLLCQHSTPWLWVPPCNCWCWLFVAPHSCTTKELFVGLGGILAKCVPLPESVFWVSDYTPGTAIIWMIPILVPPSFEQLRYSWQHTRILLLNASMHENRCSPSLVSLLLFNDTCNIVTILQS